MVLKKTLLAASLFTFGWLSLNYLSPSVVEFNKPLWAAENNSQSGKVFSIPIEVVNKEFLPKEKEKTPKKVPIEVNLNLSAEKIGLVYPKEIFKPSENIKPQGGFSCGQPSDRQLYAEAVELFNKGKYREAEKKFLELINKYPSSPYAVKAWYYLGYINFVLGNYQKAYEAFKKLCQTPYNFEWKKFACYNAIIAGLYIGKKDFQIASRYPFWKNYLLWLEGKLDDETFLSTLNCSQLEQPYRGYCLYLKAYLNPASTNEALVPPYLRESLEIRKLALRFIGGSAQGFASLTPQQLQQLFSNPQYGLQLEYLYAYYLLNVGKYNEALRYIVDLYKKKPDLGLKLAALYASLGVDKARQILSYIQAPQLWEIYVKELYNAGKYEEVLKYAPSLGLYKLAAWAAYNLGKYQLVDRYLSQVPNKDKEDYRLWLDALIRTNNWEKYQTVLSTIKNRYPDLYREFLGWYYYYHRDFAKAAALLPQKEYKAVAYLNLGEYSKVINLLSGDNSPTAKILKARAYLGLTRYRDAIEVLSGLDTPQADYLKALAYFAMGDYQKAAQMFERLSYQQKLKRPLAIVKLGDCYYNLGNYSKAKYYYLLYLREFPNGEYAQDAYLGLINIYLATGDIELADYVYNIVKKNPSLVGEDVQLKLAEGLLKNGQLTEAKELLQKLAKSKNPYVRAQAYLMLAKLEPKKAPEYLQKVIEIGLPSQQSEAVIELVRYYLNKGEKQKAKQILAKYETKITDVDTLIKLYTQLGEYLKLYYLLRELITTDPKYADVAYNIARKYYRIEFYKLAIYSLNPEVVVKSVYYLERFYLKKGDLKEALKYVLWLKVRKIKEEPLYSEIMLTMAKALHQRGYLADACSLLKEVNPKYLNTEEKLEYENLKVDCSS
ncbi:MAG: tetratricopeptide repeat protein [Aquificae bacterium]|nr:tetratricopeptide repeat protein [Aquificota bacterium]